MARPIQATPKLNKLQTVEFINRLWENQDKKEIICISDSVKATRKRKNVAKTQGGEKGFDNTDSPMGTVLDACSSHATSTNNDI